MNGKRQTIWLVSMLSLMVVLSAYYLFTEDSGATVPKETAGAMQVDGGAKNTADSTANNGFAVNEVITQGDVNGAKASSDQNTAEATPADDKSKENASGDKLTAADDSGKSADNTAATGTEGGDKASEKTASAEEGKEAKAAAGDNKSGSDKAADKKTAASNEQNASKKDAEILDEVAAQSVSASSLFTNYLYERDQNNLKQQRDLMAMINDMDKTPAENASAQEQLHALEEKESKINGIEEQLQQKYGEAVVKEDSNNSFKVVVRSDKLDVKQAVGIVDMVMKELGVTQDKISVQYVSQQ